LKGRLTHDPEAGLKVKWKKLGGQMGGIGMSCGGHLVEKLQNGPKKRKTLPHQKPVLNPFAGLSGGNFKRRVTKRGPKKRNRSD